MEPIPPLLWVTIHESISATVRELRVTYHMHQKLQYFGWLLRYTMEMADRGDQALI